MVIVNFENMQNQIILIEIHQNMTLFAGNVFFLITEVSYKNTFKIKNYSSNTNQTNTTTHAYKKIV